MIDIDRVEADYYRELGRQIAEERRARGIGAGNLAKELGVHRNTISRWENGEQAIPVLHLVRAAAILECPVPFLLPGRSFVRGQEIQDLTRERDPRKGVQSERDPWIHSDSARRRA